MPRKPKPFSFNDLSKEELSLLEHPPTEKTWVCLHVYEDDNGTKSRHEMINAGSTDVCVWCRAKRASSPKMLWPIYVSACEKIGIEPGSGKWKKVSAVTGTILREGKWSEIDLVRKEDK